MGRKRKGGEGEKMVLGGGNQTEEGDTLFHRVTLGAQGKDYVQGQLEVVKKFKRKRETSPAAAAAARPQSQPRVEGEAMARLRERVRERERRQKEADREQDRAEVVQEEAEEGEEEESGEGLHEDLPRDVALLKERLMANKHLTAAEMERLQSFVTVFE
uniref:Uncharacterized protein n=1 Tax=Chromera velia CCMP2878 TaxID=1169474 RepID=A0A0G4HGV2_9ALVE|eukprot:Cvel_27461.t1-p1 / transcript=Cvel_27461.t1 / gene=Cvel_27461 / organism=Chromera_velia_CCMP2878 / gene_product=hypothetical protein / transcript_product=hypothetical protein / location=Cvel_scaffold3429:4330-4803(-) / protein_length=158 / sequence_SO=supercontig / SO=protein_coding / is_pseudo=false